MSIFPVQSVCVTDTTYEVHVFYFDGFWFLFRKTVYCGRVEFILFIYFSSRYLFFFPFLILYNLVHLFFIFFAEGFSVPLTNQIVYTYVCTFIRYINK